MLQKTRLNFILRLPNHENAVGRPYVRVELNDLTTSILAVGIDRHLLEDLKSHLLGKFAEILERDHTDIGGVVPFIGELFRNGRITRQKKLETASPVAEIREADNALCADSQKRL